MNEGMQTVRVVFDKYNVGLSFLCHSIEVKYEVITSHVLCLPSVRIHARRIRMLEFFIYSVLIV